MNTSHARIAVTGLLTVVGVSGLVYALSGNSDNAVLAELKSMNQKIDTSAAALAGRVDNLELRLAARTETLDEQLAQLRSTNPVTATMDVSDNIARAQQDMVRLQQEIARLHDTRNLPVAANPAATAAPTLTPEQIEALAAQQRRVQTQLLETTLVAEARDPDWSVAAEDQVRTGLGKVSAELTVNDLICASTLCKLEASSTASDPAEVFRTMNEHLAWDGEMFMTINLDEGRTTAWLGRPGATLPRANNPSQ